MSEPFRPSQPPGFIRLHASAVQIGGRAIIFLGPSGAGKSTIRETLNGACRPLADDLIFLMPDGPAKWRVADAEDHAVDGPLSVAVDWRVPGVPLGPVMRIRQASAPRLERMPAIEVCHSLVEAYFQLFWHGTYPAQETRDAFAALARVARAVPGYRLFFDRSSASLAALIGAAGLGPGENHSTTEENAT